MFVREFSCSRVLQCAGCHVIVDPDENVTETPKMLDYSIKRVSLF